MTDPATPPLPPGLALAWGATPAGRRGPKPAYSIERIAEVAIELADADGVTAISLPKIAARLGLTTNALYRYVDSKDELLVVVWDAAWCAPPRLPDPAAGWRAGATAFVHELLDRYRGRPWLLDLPIRSAPTTPRVLRWMEAALEVLVATGLDRQQMVGCVLLLDGYARSTAVLDRGLSAGPPGQQAAIAEFLRPRLADLPIAATIITGGDYGDDDSLDDRDVDFGLTRILDGIAVLIERSNQSRG